MKRICVLILFSLWVWSVTAANPVAGDSVGVKVVDGKSLVVYKLSAGETAYAVSRKYGINFKDLSVANSGLNMDQLKAGQEILVP
ncbi:MAG TPA: LysM domain-containing protein, partial [Chitinophagales bacterium]|nr:LysM domain-containing protein [Chitinophagales bacterium]